MQAVIGISAVLFALWMIFEAIGRGFSWLEVQIAAGLAKTTDMFLQLSSMVGHPAILIAASASIGALLGLLRALSKHPADSRQPSGSGAGPAGIALIGITAGLIWLGVTHTATRNRSPEAIAYRRAFDAEQRAAQQRRRDAERAEQQRPFRMVKRAVVATGVQNDQPIGIASSFASGVALTLFAEWQEAVPGRDRIVLQLADRSCNALVTQSITGSVWCTFNGVTVGNHVFVVFVNGSNVRSGTVTVRPR
jgi:hypothetical protein